MTGALALDGMQARLCKITGKEMVSDSENSSFLTVYIRKDLKEWEHLYSCLIDILVQN